MWYIPDHGHYRYLGDSPSNIKKIIYHLEGYLPPDDLIKSYADFLKQKEYLRYMKFNVNVFNSLVDLLSESWKSNARVNRLVLLSKTQKYKQNAENPEIIPETTVNKLFALFKDIIFMQNFKTNVKSSDRLKHQIYLMLRGLRLRNEDLLWLCDKTETAMRILNRVLKYDYKSSVISDWARQNYEKDYIRLRRPVMTGWILDENPDFVVDGNTLTDDLEYENQIEIEKVRKHEEDMKAYQERKKMRKKPPIEDFNPFGPEDFFGGPIFEFEEKEPKLDIRPRFFEGLPSFEKHRETLGEYKRDELYYYKLKEIFTENIGIVKNLTMVWGVYYSRLEEDVKMELYQRYYTREINYVFFKIAMMHENLRMLRWLEGKK
jgi:hypothetical protein